MERLEAFRPWTRRILRLGMGWGLAILWGLPLAGAAGPSLGSLERPHTVSAAPSTAGSLAGEGRPSGNLPRFPGALTPLTETLEDVGILIQYNFFESSNAFDSTQDVYSQWSWGDPLAGTAGSGEGSVWGTNVGGAVGYIKDSFSRLRSPTLELANFPDITLALRHYYQTVEAESTCATDAVNGVESSCGDGGLLRLVYADGRVLQVYPDTPYPSLVAVGNEAWGAFAGSSNGYRTDYFDLAGMEADGVNLELDFVSNGTLQEGVGWLISSIVIYAGDAVPPTVTVPKPLLDTAEVTTPYLVAVQARDNRTVSEVALFYRLNDETSYRSGEVSRVDGTPDQWVGAIPPQPTGTTVFYYVTAVDGMGNSASAPAECPSCEPLSFRVRLPAPRNLRLTEKPEQATAVSLSWMAPEGAPYGVAGYEVRHLILNSAHEVEEEGVVADLDGVSSDLTARVAVRGYPWEDQFQVRALYQVDDQGGTAVGDYSEVVGLTLLVPRLTTLFPQAGYQGGELRLELEGEYTAFVEGDVSLDLGEGIEVLEVSVEDVTRLQAHVVVEDTAPIGYHPVKVTWPGMSIQLDPGLEVRSSSLRPRLESVSVDSIVQGEEKVVKFLGANTDFTVESPSVELGVGLELVSLTVLSDTLFEITVGAESWAPVGERSWWVVTGGVLFEVPFKVEAAPTEITSSCSLAGVRGMEGSRYSLGSVLLGAFLALRRMRRGEGGRLRGEYEEQRKRPWTDRAGLDGHAQRAGSRFG